MCTCADDPKVVGRPLPAAPRTTSAPLTLERATVVMPTVDRAVMCWTCPYARDGRGRWGVWAWAARVWRRSGRVCAGGDAPRPIVDRLSTGVCPRGRFEPEGRGTRWLGLAWIGVPMPLRWLARLLGTRGVRSGQWWGCGCVKVLREAADRLLGSVTP